MYTDPMTDDPRVGRCSRCGDTGLVRVHGPEDYGVSFESEACDCPIGEALVASDLAEQCEVCGAGPTGRCDPPDDFDSECPHGCSPER